MDYLDTFDVDSTSRKCHRVRSWYLYEQYKSLEKNQLDAAQLLKSKSYQNNILRQELKERRARRKLCDQYGLCESELKLNKTIHNCPSASSDDLFESLCELHKEYEEDELKDSCSCDSSQTSKNNNNEIENKIEDFSDSESIQSVVDNGKLQGNLAYDVKEELEVVKKKIAKNINLQLETVKENKECLEMYTKHNKECFRQNSDIEEVNDIKKVKNKTQNIFESLFSIWSNLVVFASNSIQLNPGPLVQCGKAVSALVLTSGWFLMDIFWSQIVHYNLDNEMGFDRLEGNCYCQCSSQLLTAVLACDFVRRSVDGICHILQPYVSPIKYANSDSESSLTPDTRNCGCKRKKIDNYEKLIKTYKIGGSKHCSCNKLRCKPKSSERRCCSENKYNSNYLSDNRINERIYRGVSEPWHCTGKYDNKNGGKHCRKSLYNFRKYSNKNYCNCNYLKDIVNPILKVARCIEYILQDIEETPAWL